MKLRNTFLFVTLAFLTTTTSAFADKILAPGEFHTAAFKGERVVCTGEPAPQEPESYVFNAEGQQQMKDTEMQDPNRCSGTNAKDFSSMFRAKDIAASNCVNFQCPQGYSCAVADGAMQYRARGNICVAYLPCRATRNQ